jgi:hypothetical protein
MRSNVSGIISFARACEISDFSQFTLASTSAEEPLLLKEEMSRLSRRRSIQQSPASRSSSGGSGLSRRGNRHAGRIMKMCKKVFPCLPEYKDINVIDSLRLSPFQKFSRFGRIPYKFIINVLLLLLTSIQV